MKKILQYLADRPFLLVHFLQFLGMVGYLYIEHPGAPLSGKLTAIAIAAVVITLMWGAIGFLTWTVLWLVFFSLPEARKPSTPPDVKFCVLNGPMALPRALDRLFEPKPGE